jgi:hypothetical protein
MGGCRCDECRRANTQYEIQRDKARKSGDWNGFVPAGRACRHMLKLSQRGVGRNIVAECSGVARSTIDQIRRRAKTQIRARTERRILAVTRDMRGDAALVPADATWERLNWLLEEGFTRTRLAVELGSTAQKPTLQIDKQFVTARTEARVLALYRRYQQ